MLCMCEDDLYLTHHGFINYRYYKGVTLPWMPDYVAVTSKTMANQPMSKQIELRLLSRAASSQDPLSHLFLTPNL